MAQRKSKDVDRRTEDEAAAEGWDKLLKPEPVLDWTPFITIDPNIAFGKPVVTGTRLAVEFILERFALGMSEDDVLANHPSLSPEAIRAVFAYAAALAHERQQRPAWMTEGSSSIESGPRALPR